MDIAKEDRKRIYEDLRRAWWTRMVTINAAVLTLTATQSRTFAPKAITVELLKFSWLLLSISLSASMLSLWAWSVSKLGPVPREESKWRTGTFKIERCIRSITANKVIAGIAYLTFLIGILALLLFAGFNLP